MKNEVANRSQHRVEFDQAGCIGCNCCVIACKDLHDLPAGVNWLRIKEVESGTYPDVRVVYTLIANQRECDTCLDQLESGVDPECVLACPMRVLSFTRSEGG